MMIKNRSMAALIAPLFLLAACNETPGSDDPDNTNSAPDATISTPADGSTVPEQTTITFTGTGKDAEDGDLKGTSLAWTSDRDGAIGTGETFDSTLTTGVHTIELTATDSDGESDSTSIQVSVNAAPVIDTLSVADNPADTGELVTFSWALSDAESDSLTCSLDVDSDGTPEYDSIDCGSTLSQEHTFSTSGTYQAELSVDDGTNTVVTDSVEVTIEDPTPGNTAPVINDLSFTPADPSTTDAVTFSWEVSDTDGDTLTCELDIDDDGTSDYTINDCSSTTTRDHTYSNAGTNTVRLSVSDGNASPVDTTTSVTVILHEIVISSFTATPAAVATGNSITFDWAIGRWFEQRSVTPAEGYHHDQDNPPLHPHAQRRLGPPTRP